MITLDLRDKNLLVTLSVPQKAPIRARAGSAYFYNSMELLCIALGACFGGEFIKFCSQNNINAELFESINITMENFVPIFLIQHPRNISKEILHDIEMLVKTCPVAKLLTVTPEVRFTENTLPDDILTDQTRRNRCCGG